MDSNHKIVEAHPRYTDKLLPLPADVCHVKTKSMSSLHDTMVNIG